MLKLDLIAGKGRGTIATQPIGKGALIEAAPVCTVPPEQRKLIDRTALFAYYFVRQAEYSEVKEDANGYIVFGLSSFCNHSERPNAEVKWVESDLGPWVNLVALRAIDVGEEVTILYTNIDEYTSAHSFIDTQGS